MIITEPNDFVAEVHVRVPALLIEDHFAPWVSGEAAAEALKPTPNDYRGRSPVSKWGRRPL
jgi:putative SOS response-associated peptidase YedK